MVVTYCVFFAVGYTLADKPIKITTRTDDQKPTEFYVTATVMNVTPQHRRIELYVCAAEIDSENNTRCTYAWERRSLQEMRIDQQQYPFTYRYVPRTTLLILAFAMDAEWKALATGRKVVLR